jgi:hypothetical protein
LEENEMAFMNAIKNELNNEKQLTENGAVGYRTTGKKLLDLNFSVASLRGASEQTIINKFMDAYWEDPVTAMKWLFYSRDARQGLGERRLFRILIKHLAKDKPEVVKAVFKFASEYGRYDDLWCLLDTDLKKDAIDVVREQLGEDIRNMRDGKSVSLLGKWLPSENASSKETKRYAGIIRKGLGMTSRNYRKMLSDLRKHIKVVECKMSAKQWIEIDYEAVPSRANLIYNNAFLRNDEERRRAYLGALEKGEAKINASVLFPHDIVHKYGRGYGVDSALEGMWKALPDTVKGCGNTIVVADGSGSMTCNVGGKTGVTALEVANSLAIYFAERSSGESKDKYITFSERPQLVDFSKTKTLRDKIGIALSHNEVANTNIEAVFDLILSTAVNNHMSQDDIPANVLIVSDMEFDSCATSGAASRNSWGWYSSCVRPTTTLFDTIAKKYAIYGYKLPRLVFWNVNSRTGTVPVKENDLGVALVSGFSVNIVNMVMSNKLDPYECLLDVLNVERYQPIEDAVKGIC